MGGNPINAVDPLGTVVESVSPEIQPYLNNLLSSSESARAQYQSLQDSNSSYSFQYRQGSLPQFNSSNGTISLDPAVVSYYTVSQKVFYIHRVFLINLLVLRDISLLALGQHQS